MNALNQEAYRISNLSFGYNDEVMILEDISTALPRGKVTGIIGPNGSGKTTLIKNLSRVLSPDKGSIFVLGKALTGYRQRELALVTGMVFQEKETTFEFSVFDLVMMGRYPYKKKFEMENDEDRLKVLEALEKTDVLELKDKCFTALSGGEKQRVMIARALAQEPEILILDEPIAHLDLHHQVEILNLVRRLVKEKQISVLMILHDLNFAYGFCDEVVLLKSGRIYKQGDPRQVITKENIKQVYEADIDIILDHRTNRHHIIPAY